MKVLSFFLGIGILLMLLWLPYFSYMLGPVATSDMPDVHATTATSTVSFSIAKGDGVKKIAESLEGRGFIRSASAFKFYTFLTGTAHQLKPGLYDISLSSSTPDLVNAFVEGPPNEITVFIQEGQTLNSIDALLSKFGVLQEGELKKFPVRTLQKDFPFTEGAENLEGFLFPDTYRFYLDSDPKDVVEVFLKNFDRRITPELENASTKKAVYSEKKKSLSEILTIASLIEKEVAEMDERQVVSGIIYKRLALDMPLQIDATLPYADVHGEAYDTYKYYGLPPGPICNPGLGSIIAALSPTSTPYLYYLSDPKTGEIIFSRTFDEHDDNRARYLRSAQ